MTVEQYPISIRFVGKNLDTHSVPIYELGEVLVALQRMINRAYLFSISTTGTKGAEALLEQRSIHKKSTRQALALQLAGREAGSDVYHLNWFTEKMGSQVAQAMLAQMAEAASAYRRKKVYSGPIHNPTSVDSNASALYGEFQALSNRIRSVGDIDKIEITMQGRRVPIVIDRETKEYIRKLQKLEYLGDKDVIGGYVVTVHVHSKDAVDMYLPDRNRRVRVRVSKPVYRRIIKALSRDDNPYFEFRGKPRLKVGYLVSEFREFVASFMDVTPSAPLPGQPVVRVPRAAGQRKVRATAAKGEPITRVVTDQSRVSVLAGKPVVQAPIRSLTGKNIILPPQKPAPITAGGGDHHRKKKRK